MGNRNGYYTQHSNMPQSVNRQNVRNPNQYSRSLNSVQASQTRSQTLNVDRTRIKNGRPYTGQNGYMNNISAARQGNALRRSDLTMQRGKSRKRPIRHKNTTLRDFFLGLLIGFAVFGTAAIFVVRAITELFI